METKRDGLEGRLWVSAAKRGALLAAIWAGLVRGDAEGLVLGLLAVPVAVWLSLQLLPPIRPLRLWQLLRMLPSFHLRSAAGGVDVAARAFDPRLPLRPGWVVRPVPLPDGGRVALGADLSLMPGTLVAGSDGERLLLHALDSGAGPEAALAEEAERIARLVDDGAGQA